MTAPDSDAKPTHLVSVSIIDYNNNPVGVAVFDVVWPDGCPARDNAGVVEMSRIFTEARHRNGTLPADCRYVITGWSEYGRD